MFFRGCEVEVLEPPLPPRLGHPYQSERGVKIQCPGTARSPNPLQHKAETPHVGMQSCLEACLARPTHILFRMRRSTFYNEPICRAPRSILILQHVSGHKSTPQASLALTQNLMSIRVGCSCGTRTGCGVVYILRTLGMKRS